MNCKRRRLYFGAGYVRRERNVIISRRQLHVAQFTFKNVDNEWMIDVAWFIKWTSKSIFFRDNVEASIKFSRIKLRRRKINCKILRRWICSQLFSLFSKLMNIACSQGRRIVENDNPPRYLSSGTVRSEIHKEQRYLRPFLSILGHRVKRTYRISHCI